MSHPSIIIKKEPDLEFNEIERNLIPQIPFEVNVKIENCTSLDNNWCLETALFNEFDKQFNKTERYECQLCTEYFAERYSLFKHNLTHLKIILKKSIFQCSICSVYFTKKNTLIDHISKHTVLKRVRYKSNKGITKVKHQCHVCGKVLPYKSWHDHVRQVHSTERVQCGLCGKDFKCNRTLQKHQKYIHKGFTAKWRHRSVISENVPCNECNKIFHDNSTLKTHQRNCHSTRQYQCYICKSILKCKQYLMTHMRRVHYFDGKEHICDICGKKFKSPRYVKIHIKNSHFKCKSKDLDKDC